VTSPVPASLILAEPVPGRTVSVMPSPQGRRPVRTPGVRFVCVVALLVVLASSLPGRVSADDTINAPGPLSPRELSVAVPEGTTSADLVLRDAVGRVVPLTGAGVLVAGGVARVFPPKLAEGSYALVHPGGEEVVVVGDAAAAAETPAGGSRPSLLLFAVPFLVLGVVLGALRRPWPAGLALALGVGVALVPAVRGGASDVSAPDPCSAVAIWEDRVRCMSAHMRDVLVANGVAAAVDRLEFLASRPGGRWATDCHEIAHYLGQIAWKETADVGRLLDAGTLSCSFGYFHGLLESMGTYSDDVSFPATSLALCAGLGGRFAVAEEDGSVRECAHGIGHAAMWRHNEDLTAARPVCAALPEESWREECDSGAVMSWVFAREAARTEGRPQDAPVPTVGKPVDLCAPPHGSPTRGCVDGALSGTLFAEYEESLAWCRARPASAEACSGSLGRRLMTWEVEGVGPAAPQAVRLCGEIHAQDAARQDCMATMSWMHLHVLRDYAKTSVFCDLVGAAFSSGCREGVLRFYETMIRRGDGSAGEIPEDVAAEIESRGR